MIRNEAPKWLEEIIEIMPDEMTEDEVAATVITIVVNYCEGVTKAGPLLLSLPLTFFRASGLDLEILRRAYQGAADGVATIIEREAKEQRH